jgi:hypothetical protein
MTTKRIIAREWIVFVACASVGMLIALSVNYLFQPKFNPRAPRLIALASALSQMPDYSDQSAERIAASISAVLSSNDTSKIANLAHSLSSLPNYAGWKEREIIDNAKDVLQSATIRLNVFQDFGSATLAIYVIVIFVRSLVWSVKTLKSKEKP